MGPTELSTDEINAVMAVVTPGLSFAVWESHTSVGHCVHDLTAADHPGFVSKAESVRAAVYGIDLLITL